MSNTKASSDNNGEQASVSRQSMKRSRRTRNASQSNSADSGSAASNVSSSASNPSQSAQPSVEQTHALVVSSRRKRYTDNRPVDPSPIAVVQTVRMAGDRPIQASPGMSAAAQPSFNDSPQIMNRPIAPNTSPDEEEMLGYLD